MESQTIAFKQIHDDHYIWLSELDNNWNKIVGFRHKLKNLPKLNKAIAMDIELNQIEAQFSILEQSIERISDNIKMNQFWLNNILSPLNIREDDRCYGEHKDLATEIQILRQLYLETEKKYYDFIST